MYVLTKPLSFLRSREQALEFLSGGLFSLNLESLHTLQHFIVHGSLYDVASGDETELSPLEAVFFSSLATSAFGLIAPFLSPPSKGAPLLFPFIANHSPMRLLSRLPVLANIMVKGKGDLA